jgi:hypothetical protein
MSREDEAKRQGIRLRKTIEELLIMLYHRNMITHSCVSQAAFAQAWLRLGSGLLKSARPIDAFHQNSSSYAL